MDNFSRVEIGRMNYFRTTSKSTDSEKFDPFTSGSGAFVLEQEQKRGRQSIDNQNHPNVSSRGRRENLDYPAAMRPISASATSASTRTAGNSSGSSVSENPSVGMLRRRMMGLYKNITGNEPDEKALEEINDFLQTEPDKKNIGNETRWIENLKIHLIRQGREREAKRLAELYQKLKGMTVMKNREAIIGLMFGLFDKEVTRAIMAGKAPHKSLQCTPVSSNSNGQDYNLQHSEAKDAKCNQQQESHLKMRNQISHNERDGYFQREDMDYTPIPRLHSSSDNLLSHDMKSGSKVPCLAKPSQESKKDTEKATYFTSLDQPQNALHGSDYSMLHLVSKISKKSDESTRIVPSFQHSALGSTPDIFSSTPIDHSGAGSKHKQYVNINRKPPEPHKSVSTRPNSASFKATGTAHTFANTKSMERDLIRDIVFILQGIEGTHIKSTAKGTFEIKTKAMIHPTLRLQTLKLCELGYCFTKIKNYCEKPTTGLMTQAFKQAIQKELQEFYRLLAVIQEKIQQIVVDTPMSEDLPLNKLGDMTLLKLGIWLFECRPRMQVVSGMVESCESKRGGDLCSVIHRYSQHGDPLVNTLTVSLLSTICKPLYIMLSQWILYGELEDPFNEFFIAADSACKKEQLWHLKYRIRSQMLPSFIPMRQAEKILAIGKNINFLKEICNNAKGYEGRYEIKALLETGEVECLFLSENSPIQYAIEMSYKTTSEKVLKVLIDDSNLLDHLKAIKKYLLLGQGDFIQYFLELIQDELSKPASKLYSHNISAILESAVRATNAQFENEDVLSRLDTRILPTSDKDLGWDVFCLDYKAHGPIGTVLTEDVMNGYNKLFNSLWRTKRIEIILSTLWKNQTVLFKYLRLIPELAPVLHRSQLLISEMIHFVHQTQYYIMFEATECAWERLMEEVNKSSDLDEVIKSHQKFLDTIFKRSLLDADSRDLLNQLRGIFDSVHELRVFLLDFNERVEVEVKNRKHLQPNTEEVRDAQRQFFSSYVMQAKGKIETLYTTTQDLVRTFLLVLNRQQDLTLQCLSFRLDFNEYYHHKDSRLSQPLTFQHRRLSSNAFTPLNISGSFTGGNPMMTSLSIPEIYED